MRTLAKTVLETSLTASGLATAWRRVRGLDRVILAYHNVVPDADPGVGDTSLHLPLSSFRAQLDLLSNSHRVVSLVELLEDTAREEPLAAVTFDDAYRGAVTLGLEELLSRGLPSTVFVCPGLLGGEGFWWDRVADEPTGSVTPEFRREALGPLGGRGERILNAARKRGLSVRDMPDLYRPASAEELHGFRRHPLVALGSHTWTHVSLPWVPVDEAREELGRSLAWAEEQGNPGASQDVLSLPYGLWTRDLAPVLEEMGYTGVLLISGGPWAPSSPPPRIAGFPRINVPRGVSVQGIELRIKGVWPC